MTVQKLDPLKLLGDMASLLEGEAFLDSTSPAQRREYRRAADGLREGIEAGCGELTPPVLLAFYQGAACQAEVSGHADPVRRLLGQVLGGGDQQVHLAVSLTVSYLARDLLADGRVE